MKYRDNWELDTIPEPTFKSEVARRSSFRRKTLAGGRKATCECGVCLKCRKRISVAESRKRKKTEQI